MRSRLASIAPKVFYTAAFFGLALFIPFDYIVKGTVRLGDWFLFLGCLSCCIGLGLEFLVFRHRYRLIAPIASALLASIVVLTAMTFVLFILRIADDRTYGVPLRGIYLVLSVATALGFGYLLCSTDGRWVARGGSRGNRQL